MTSNIPAYNIVELSHVATLTIIADHIFITADTPNKNKRKTLTQSVQSLNVYIAYKIKR